jgi:hypothetical protein
METFGESLRVVEQFIKRGSDWEAGKVFPLARASHVDALTFHTSEPSRRVKGKLENSQPARQRLPDLTFFKRRQKPVVWLLALACLIDLFSSTMRASDEFFKHFFGSPNIDTACAPNCWRWLDSELFLRIARLPERSATQNSMKAKANDRFSFEA